jgi:hypothetical protein
VYAYTNKNEYSEGTHKAIIELIDIIFYNSIFIVEWNKYIERLLREMEGTKGVPVKKGGMLTFGKKTRKISRK